MGEVNPIHSNSSPVLKATKIPPLPIIVLGSVSFLLPEKCQVCIAKDHAADRIGTKLIQPNFDEYKSKSYRIHSEISNSKVHSLNRCRKGLSHFLSNNSKLMSVFFFKTSWPDTDER